MGTGSLVYRKAKRDRNETSIVRFLRRCGATVRYLDDPGIPDLVIGYGGITLLAEIKTGKRGLTAAQKSFFAAWQGQAIVLRTIVEAKQLLRSVMPIYCYRCTECEQEFEKQQRMSDEPLKECPYCGKPIIRVPQPVAVVYRGGGWGRATPAHHQPEPERE